MIVAEFGTHTLVLNKFPVVSQHVSSSALTLRTSMNH